MKRFTGKTHSGFIGSAMRSFGSSRLGFALVSTMALPFFLQASPVQKEEPTDAKTVSKLTEEEKEIIEDREMLENLALLQDLDAIDFLDLLDEMDPDWSEGGESAEPAEENQEGGKQ